MLSTRVSYACESPKAVTDNARVARQMLFSSKLELFLAKTGDHAETHIERVAFITGLHGGNKRMFIFRVSSSLSAMFLTTPIGVVYLHVVPVAAL